MRMHVFDYRMLTDSLPADIAGVSNIIFDLRARNEMRRLQDGSGFDRLREAAIVESVRGSNAIEGIVTTRARLAELMGGAEPHTHGERELMGYRAALQEMYAPDFSADLTEDYVHHLHRLLLGSTSTQAGTYKLEDNWIQERDASGRIRVRFVPVPAGLPLHPSFRRRQRSHLSTPHHHASAASGLRHLSLRVNRGHDRQVQGWVLRRLGRGL